MVTEGHQLQPKKVERAEEQVESSCLTREEDCSSGVEKDHSQETFLGQIAESFSIGPDSEETRKTTLL